MAKQNKRSLLVFSTDLREGPLSSMVYNVQKDVLDWWAVNVPYMVGKEEDFLEDIAVVTGAQILRNDDIIEGIDDLKVEHFGGAAKVIITENSTQIIKGSGTQEAMDDHLDTIRTRIEAEDSKHFK